MNKVANKSNQSALTELSPDQVDDVNGGWVYETAVVVGGVAYVGAAYTAGSRSGYSNNRDNNSGGGGGGGGGGK